MKPKKKKSRAHERDNESARVSYKTRVSHYSKYLYTPQRRTPLPKAPLLTEKRRGFTGETVDTYRALSYGMSFSVPAFMNGPESLTEMDIPGFPKAAKPEGFASSLQVQQHIVRVVCTRHDA